MCDVENMIECSITIPSVSVSSLRSSLKSYRVPPGYVYPSLEKMKITLTSQIPMQAWGPFFISESICFSPEINNLPKILLANVFFLTSQSFIIPKRVRRALLEEGYNYAILTVRCILTVFAIISVSFIVISVVIGDAQPVSLLAYSPGSVVPRLLL